MMEITHNVVLLMICDVHFGDTRYDITPASLKWLPNNYPEEQTQPNNKLSVLHNVPSCVKVT